MYDPAPVPFIIGLPRSGTTLLRYMLDSHPDLAIPPETHFLPRLRSITGSDDTKNRERFYSMIVHSPHWLDFNLSASEFYESLSNLETFSVSDGLRAFYSLYSERFKKHRWGDKTTSYYRSFEWIQQLLPEARFIHMVRDGRDVHLSQKEVWFANRMSVLEHAGHWRQAIINTESEGQRCRYFLTVKFDDLVLYTRRQLVRICGFLDLPFSSDMEVYFQRVASRQQEVSDLVARGRIISKEQRLATNIHLLGPPDAGRLRRWKQEMTEEENRQYWSIAGDLMQTLGYTRE